MIAIKKNAQNKYLQLLPYGMFFLALMFSTIAIGVEAHPGGTNSDGCHYDYNGSYHCH